MVASRLPAPLPCFPDLTAPSRFRRQTIGFAAQNRFSGKAAQSRRAGLFGISLGPVSPVRSSAKTGKDAAHTGGRSETTQRGTILTTVATHSDHDVKLSRRSPGGKLYRNFNYVGVRGFILNGAPDKIRTPDRRPPEFEGRSTTAPSRT